MNFDYRMDRQKRPVRGFVESAEDEYAVFRWSSAAFRVRYEAIFTESGEAASRSAVVTGKPAMIALFAMQVARVYMLESDQEEEKEVGIYSVSLRPVERLRGICTRIDCIQLLEMRFHAYRQLSTDPSVSLWTLLAVAYLEQIASGKVASERLDPLLVYCADGEAVRKPLSELKTYLAKGGKGSSWLTAKCCDGEFWRKAGKATQQLVLSKCMSQDVPLSARGSEELVDLLLADDPVAIFTACARVLETKIYTFSLHDWKRKYEPKAKLNQPSNAIYLLKDVNQFYLLYPKEKAVEKQEHAREVIEDLSTLVTKNLRLITDLMTSEHCFRLFPSDFSLETVNFPFNLLKQLKASEIPAEIKSDFQQLLAECRTRLFCPVCGSRYADIALQCSHRLCSFCLQQYIRDILGEDPLRMSESGEPRESLKCFFADCYVHIDRRTIETHCGEEFLLRMKNDTINITN